MAITPPESNIEQKVRQVQFLVTLEVDSETDDEAIQEAARAKAYFRDPAPSPEDYEAWFAGRAEFLAKNAPTISKIEVVG